MADRELAGAVAVVTGSRRGLGRAIALQLGAAGAAVVVNSRTSREAAQAVADEIGSAGGRAVVHLADVTVQDQAEGLIAAALAAFGRIDVLVNNVAQRVTGPVTGLSLDDWRGVLSSALDSTFLCIRAAVPFLAAGGRGAVVNIGGGSGHAGVANRAAVAASKAGVAGMSAALAVELAPRGITVNCVAPGYIEAADRQREMPEQFRIHPIPLARPGAPDDVALMVRHLCGPAGRYVTGQTIHVNGGWHVTMS
ncbi:MAG: SDR family NAD(P)-dependent oxidoreductase [Rhodospirillales bacterium]